MVSFEDEESASSFLKAKSIWGPWFSKLVLWEGQSLSPERVAWLKIVGIPLHLSCPEVLNSVGEFFGKVLHVPTQVEEDKDLSVFRVGILVGEFKRFQEYVTLRWKDRQFRVWVEEELVAWVPDCLGRELQSSNSLESPLLSSPVVHRPVVNDGEDEEVSTGDSNPEGVRAGGSVPESSGVARKNDGVPPFGCQSNKVGETSSKVGGIRNNGIFFF
ncbi:hypothetical protein HanOQP8_Chr02g0048471 [Helianthus annuus]|nr:hypothetical protein HanOQP8_Chr02g0048471 [Helianthus annuus]